MFLSKAPILKERCSNCGTMGYLYEQCPKCSLRIHLQGPRCPAGPDFPAPPGPREPQSSPPKVRPKSKQALLTISEWSRMIRGYIRFCVSIRYQSSEAKLKELEARIRELENRTLELGGEEHY